MIDLNTVNGIVRAVVPASIAYAVGRGWVPANTSAPDLTAAVVTIIAALWSIHSNRK